MCLTSALASKLNQGLTTSKQLMATTLPLRRSSRPKRSKVPIEEYSCYPDGPPSTQLEEWVFKLDKQSFPWADFARIDDVVVVALFASKRNPTFYRALLPARAFSEEGMAVPTNIALEICNIYTAAAKISTDSPTVASNVTALLVEKYPDLFSGKNDGEILKHLLQRYHILRYSPLSNVRVDKVLFKGSTKVSCGLKATSNISAATVILSLCSSMSSDLISGRSGISVIRSVACQSGEEGERLILGPFRFANHDCSPNCQIMPIPKSSAYTLCTLRNIVAGEAITVKYSNDGTYFNGISCKCATCNPDSPPIATKRPIDVSKFAPKPGKKKPRGGDRARRAKRAEAKRRMERELAGLGNPTAPGVNPMPCV